MITTSLPKSIPVPTRSKCHRHNLTREFDKALTRKESHDHNLNLKLDKGFYFKEISGLQLYNPKFDWKEYFFLVYQLVLRLVALGLE